MVQQMGPIEDREGWEGDSDTFPSDVGNANFPDYLSASRSGAAGVSAANRCKTRSFPTLAIDSWVKAGHLL
jgi:hypothetical protein